MKQNKINILIITLVFILISLFLYGRTNSVIIDFSRESYIPYQMLHGKIFGSQILLIYGVFGYLINMLLYKISINLNFLYLEGLFFGISTSILFYFIIKKFFPKKLSLVFTLFFITVSVFSASNFSFVMPYSYSTLWGILGIYSVLFCLLYKKKTPIYLLLGFVAINKLELFLGLLIIIFIFDIFKKQFLLKNYFLTLIFPFLTIIFYPKIDYFQNFAIIKNMVNTHAIKVLYHGMGSFFDIKYFIYNIKYLFIYFIISLISYFLFKKCKILSIIFIFVALFILNPDKICHLSAIIAVILTIVNAKKIKTPDLILLSICLVLSSKAIFALCYLSYSNFGFILLVIYVFKMLGKIVDKKWCIANVLIIFSIMSLNQLQYYLKHPKFPLKTPVGTVWLNKNEFYLSGEIKNYLDKNLKENENMIVVPEGQIFNLMYKKSWNFVNSTFTPLDFETFGEENIINKLKENKTDYIIFYPRNTLEYGAETICYDYAVDFCEYIMDNYTRTALFEKEQKALIFKINEK